jgi:ligand-binding sensor domain-containing protein
MLWHNDYWTHSFFAYNTKFGLSDTFVSAICEDREGNLWVGTYSGLNRFREGRFFNELNNEDKPYDRVNTLFEDREGNLWVGSREGLTRLTPRRFFTYTKRQGLTHNNVMSVLEDRSGDSGLVGERLSLQRNCRRPVDQFRNGSLSPEEHLRQDACPFPHRSGREILAALVNTGVGYSHSSI